jgi:filamentous hemagglutinin
LAGRFQVLIQSARTIGSCVTNASVSVAAHRNGSQAGAAPAAPPRNGRFASDGQLQDHFNRHGGDFGARTAAEYEAQANTFLNGPRGPGVLEKTRPNGDIVRYNPATDEFGVVKPDGTIRTYYKPDPARHGRPTNLDYFNAQ